MAKAYSADLRERTPADYDASLRPVEVSRRYRVSQSWVFKLLKPRPLYLPPYSLDFNPIKQVFAKVKARLRQYSERTVEALWERIGQLVDRISPAECCHYFRNCGYALH